MGGNRGFSGGAGSSGSAETPVATRAARAQVLGWLEWAPENPSTKDVGTPTVVTDEVKDRGDPSTSSQDRLLAAKPGIAMAALRLDFSLWDTSLSVINWTGSHGTPGAFLPVGPSVSISPHPYLEMEGWWLDQQQDWPVRTAHLRA